MNMFSNLSIKFKLGLLALIPLAALVFFSLSDIRSKWNEAEEMSKIQDISKLSVFASALVHETQKERGATAGFLGSKGKAFVAELPSQRRETDRKAAELRDFLKNFDANNYGSKYARSLNDALTELKRIDGIRNSVSNQSIAAKDAIRYFTNMNSAFLNTIALTAKVTDNGEIVKEITSYINFLQGKERAGIERAVMSNVFARGEFGAGGLQRFGSLVTQQDTYVDVFKTFATEDQKNFYADKMRGAAAQQVKAMRKIAFEKASEGNFGIRATDWFNAATGRINLLKEIENKLSNDLAALAGKLKAEAQALLVFYAILTGTVLTLVAFITIAVTRSIVVPLRKALDALTDIAEGEGDLTRRLYISGKDEIAQLAIAFNKFVEKISGVVLEVRQNSESIVVGSQQISEGNASLSQRTEEQASSLEETASSMEEMTGTVKQNADSASEAKQLADANRQKATGGAEVIARTVTAMSEINESSTRIADIIGTIDGIAFQTNLLALNAAVEAARAGEQGRGFAVVASEVRSLAQRSADAAKEIKNLIGDSVGKVKIGTELVDESGQTLEEIVEGIKKVADIVAEIAAASNEQASGIDQVNNAITQMDNMTQDNAALVEEAAASSRSMLDQASALRTLVGFFKLDDHSKSIGRNVSPGLAGNSATNQMPQPTLETATQPSRVKPSGKESTEWEQF